MVRFTASRCLLLSGILFFSMDLPVMAAPEWVGCDAGQTWVFAQRLHVFCSVVGPAELPAAGLNLEEIAKAKVAQLAPFRFFAISTSNPIAPLVLQELIAAQAEGMTLEILTDLADTSGDSMGCGVADCRKILEVRLSGRRK